MMCIGKSVMLTKVCASLGVHRVMEGKATVHFQRAQFLILPFARTRFIFRPSPIKTRNITSRQQATYVSEALKRINSKSYITQPVGPATILTGFRSFSELEKWVEGK